MSAICSEGIYPTPGTGQFATALAYFAIERYDRDAANAGKQL
jgi:hypothetical protein